MTSGDVHRRWSLFVGTELLSHTRDDETLVYNCLSGDTHLLDNLSAALLELLQAEVLAESDLIAAVARELAIAPDEAVDAVRQRLDNLRQLDLICELDS